MPKYKYCECVYDEEGILRIKRFISKKEFDKSKKITFRVKPDDWRAAKGRLAHA